MIKKFCPYGFPGIYIYAYVPFNSLGYDQLSLHQIIFDSNYPQE